METVLLTSFENLEDVRTMDASSRIHVAVKFDKFYLAAGSSFSDLQSTNGSNSNGIFEKLRKFKFWTLIPNNSCEELDRDFQLCRIYLAAVHVCAAVKNTLNNELDDVSFENSMRYHLPKWNSDLFDTFILFSESESSDEKNETALRTLLCSLLMPVNRSMIGEPVTVISTPFKNLILFNTFSQGIICNVFGENNCGFLVDVKLSLGCEGSPVFSSQNRLLGMVMNVFTWVRGEWIGFSVAVNLYAVVCSWICSSYPKLYQSIEHKPSSIKDNNIDSYGVVVVSTRHKWGTGIVLNKIEGVIITCSHVVDFTTRTAVTITFKGESVHGKILYATPEGTPFDLAIIRVQSAACLKEIVEFKKPTQKIGKGETVYVIGYPLISSRKHSMRGPSLSRGYVANVYPAAMTLTTCVTHSGASGGALIRPNRELLGVVANNVIIRNEKLLVPHITVVIPFDVFWTPVERFCSNQRVADLDILTSLDPKVRNIWQLTFAGRFLKSKL